MRSEHPIIVPDEDLCLAVMWHGGVTFEVRMLDPHTTPWELGHEVDVFTAYGDQAERPTISEAYRHIVDRFTAMKQEMAEEFDAQEQAMRDSMREEDDDA